MPIFVMEEEVLFLWLYPEYDELYRFWGEKQLTY